LNSEKVRKFGQKLNLVKTFGQNKPKIREFGQKIIETVQKSKQFALQASLKIKSQQKIKLYDTYRLDFELFGYGIPDYLMKSASNTK